MVQKAEQKKSGNKPGQNQAKPQDAKARSGGMGKVTISTGSRSVCQQFHGWHMGMYYVEPIPEATNYIRTGDKATDAKLFIGALDQWIRREDDMKSNRSQLYGMIWCYLSLESKNKVRGYKDYEVWSKEKDPEKLRQAITDTHKVGSTVSEVKKRQRGQHMQVAGKVDGIVS